MRPTQRSLVVLISAVQIFCPPTSSAFQAVTEPDASYQLYTDAKAREVEARAAHERTIRELQAAESAAVAAANEEWSVHDRQIAELERIEEEIVNALDRLAAAGRSQRPLLLELDVLERWYRLFEPVVANLTERSFLGVERELDALAREGLIESGSRSFRTYGELRAAIARLHERLGRKRQAAERTQAAIRAEVVRLDARRREKLAELATPSPRVSAADQEWLAAAAKAVRAGNDLLDAENAVLAAYHQVAIAAEKLGPPVLASVSLHAADQVIYRAEWRLPDGRTADEQVREQARTVLRERWQTLIDEIDDVQAWRRAAHAGRLEAAERMALRGQQLARWTERYRQDLLVQWGANVGFEIGLTLAEIALTGGAATLERKTTELADAAAASVAASRRKASEAGGRVTVKLAGEVSEALEVAPPIHVPLLTFLKREGDTAADAMRRATSIGLDIVKGQAEAHANELVRRGFTRTQADRIADRMYGEAVRQLNQSAAFSRAAAAAASEERGLREVLRALDVQVPLPGAGGAPDLHTAVFALRDIYTVKGGVHLARKTLEDPNSPFSGITKPADSATDVLVGDALEFAGNALVNAYRQTPALAGADALSRWARFKNAVGGTLSPTNIGVGLKKNVSSVGLGAISTAIKYFVAKSTDQLLNTDAEVIANLMAELSYSYADYYVQLQDDQELVDHLRALTADLAAASQALLELKTGYVLTRTAEPPVGALEGPLQLELGFSLPLLAAPQTQLGDVETRLSEVPGSGGTRWRGSFAAGAVPAGEHVLAVAVPPEATPFGSLDSDPATAAVRKPGRAEWTGFETGPDRLPGTAALKFPGLPDWSGFERGPDTNHTIRLTVETARRTESPWDNPDPNSPWDKAGFGETVSSGPRATPQPEDAPYFGRWRARINRADGPPVFLDLLFYAGCARAVSADGVSRGSIDELSFENGRLRGRTLDAWAFDHPWFEGFDVAIAADAARGEWLSTGFSDRAATEWRRVAPRVRDVSVQSRDGQQLTLAVRGEDLPLAGRGADCGEARSESAGISVIAARGEGDVLLLTVRIEPGVADGTKHLVLNGFRVPWEWRGP